MAINIGSMSVFLANLDMSSFKTNMMNFLLELLRKFLTKDSFSIIETAELSFTIE